MGDGSGVAVVIVNYNGEAAAARVPRRAGRPDARARGDRRRRQRLARRVAGAAARPPPRTSHALALGRNHGFAGGANRGVRATSAPWVCVLNSDATPAPDWLAQLIAAPRDERTWALGSVLVSAATRPDRERRRPVRARGLRLQAAARPPAGRRCPPSPIACSPRPARRPSFAATSSTRSAATRSASSCTTRTSTWPSARCWRLPRAARAVRAGHAPARRDDALAGPRALLRRPQQRLVRRALPAATARPRALARRWALELRTNRPRRLAPVEVAGSARGAGRPAARAARAPRDPGRAHARRRARSRRCCARPRGSR